ncbi:MAG: ATP-binding cassette domain-containing protein [Firmicutes bacterium]|nr:ATP-binding cassette domain-containing protein [Bacillota bacterium]
MSSSTLLEARELKKYFPIQEGAFLRKKVGWVKAVDGVSFSIRRGETVGLVGESGCGKTTTGRMLLRIIEPTAGSIIYHDSSGPVDIAELDRKELWNLRRRMQMIFQDPYSSLNPRMTVQEIVQEPLYCYGVGTAAERKERVVKILKVVGLDPKFMSRYPHAFSGGQRQRIGIARALILNPEIIIADEPVSALDVSIQAQVLNLLQDLQAQFNLTFLFISHDLSVVEHLCDRTMVMYLGRIVEMADTEELFDNPLHPYVETLLSAVPRPEPGFRFDEQILEGEAEGYQGESKGCAFAPRCRYAKAICHEEVPELREMASNGSPHVVSCHLAESLELKGVGSAPSQGTAG